MSVALHAEGGMATAVSGCRALSDVVTNDGKNESTESWRELPFCDGCADAEGCLRFCDCLDGTVACPQLTHATIGQHRSDSPWGSLLPISILIFFGGFMCQMYIKNNRRGIGGGLGGRGNPEEEGTELLGCMPRGRRRPDEDNEKMMPSQRGREAYRGGRVPDDDDGML